MLFFLDVFGAQGEKEKKRGHSLLVAFFFFCRTGSASQWGGGVCSGHSRTRNVLAEERKWSGSFSIMHEETKQECPCLHFFVPEYSLSLVASLPPVLLTLSPPTAQIKRRFLCHTTQGVVPHSLSCSSYSPFCDSSRSSLSPPIIPRCHPDPQTYNPPFRFLCVPLRPPRTIHPSWAESHRQRQAAAAPRAGGRVGCLPPTVFFFFFFFYKRGDGWQKTRQKATQHYCSPILRRFAFSGEASRNT